MPTKIGANLLGYASMGFLPHDTIGRFFRLVDPKVFENCFIGWILIADKIQGVIAIDGKTICNSDDPYTKQKMAEGIRF